MRFIESITFTIIGAFIGYLISNRLAIDRDKRKEFNRLINPIRETLLSMRNYPGSDFGGNWDMIFILIREKIPFWKRKGFDRAVKNYKKSKSSENVNINIDGMVGWSYKDTEYIIHAVNNLLKFFKPK